MELQLYNKFITNTKTLKNKTLLETILMPKKKSNYLGKI